jgi:hypothetical protein
VLQPGSAELQANGIAQPCSQLRLLQVVAPWQATSHAHDEPQRTSRHDRVPVQATRHGPAPHVMPWQLWAPLQVISHAMSVGQRMPLRHELAVEHRMLQFQPAGHATAPVQPPLWPQSMVHVRVASLHEVHAAGQTAASPGGESATTQNPSTQTRFSAQG